MTAAVAEMDHRWLGDRAGGQILRDLAMQGDQTVDAAMHVTHRIHTLAGRKDSRR